jgi:hypothetical protein
MKKLLFIFILFVFEQNVSAQNSTKQFLVTTYINGNIYREKMENINTDSDSINLSFMRKHFYEPNYFPEKFIDSNYKNETIVIWKNKDKVKDFKTNWTNTYVYDSDSRVIEYSYSGCIACSNMPYNFKVFYDENNNVIRLENNISEKQKFELKYNQEREIIELKAYSSSNKLTKK